MPYLTPNIDLKKPLLTEAADIEVINENMDKIDSEIAKIRDSAKREHLADLFTNGIIPNALKELEITQTDTPSKAIKIDTGKINLEGIVYTYNAETIIDIDPSDALEVTNEPHTTDESGALTLTYFPVSNQAEDELAAITDIAVTKVNDGSTVNVKAINPETGEVTTDALNEAVQVNYKSFSKRIDIVYVNTDGILKVFKGNPVLPIFDPTVPSLAEGTFRLGEINLSPNFNVITNNMVKSDDVFYSINSLEDELDEVNAKMAELMPVGGIIMWSGLITNIPNGWALCDGQNGTPDLRDRFIMGATSDGDIGNTGGQSTVKLTTSHMPSHKHTGTASSGGSHTHTGTASSGGSHTHRILMRGKGSGHGIDTAMDTEFKSGYSEASGTHTHSLTIDSVSGHTHSLSIGYSGSNQAHENKPPYFKLAFIMKV